MDSPLRAPQQFLCPISLELMTDPVTISTGITYDRAGIEKWLKSGHQTCPVTNQVLENKDLLSNVVLRRLINEWCLHNNWLTSPGNFTTHCSSQLVSNLLQTLEDGNCPLGALKELRTIALQNKSNTEKISSVRGLRILHCLLDRQIKSAATWSSQDDEIYREIFGVLCLLSLNEETKFTMTQDKALLLAVRILQEDDMQIKVDFLRLLGNLARERQFRVRICAIRGQLLKILSDFLRKDINAALVETTVVALGALCVENVFRTTALNSGIATRVGALIQSVEGAVCEKSIELLQILLSFQSCQKVSNDGAAIIVPALTCVMLGVSETVTEHATGILCKLCTDKRCCHEAVRNGGVANALLLLQAQCKNSTRRKAMELLQLLSKECKQVPHVYSQGSPKLAIKKLEMKA